MGQVILQCVQVGFKQVAECSDPKGMGPDTNGLWFWVLGGGSEERRLSFLDITFTSLSNDI